MGNTNSIPIVSQAKSGIQLICGDVDGAVKTQETFLKECPGVSQITSTVQLISGDPEGALETQKQCGRSLLNAADGIPVVGHVKGVVHYAVGDIEGGNTSMLRATRTTGVIVGGGAGFLVGGPAGAVAGGISGGAAIDTITTIGSSAINDEFSPTGYYAGINNAVNNPNPGDIFDLGFMVVADGVSGYGAGKAVQNIQNSSSPQAPTAETLETAQQLKAQAYEALENIETSKSVMTEMEYITEARRAGDLYNQAQQLEGKASVTPGLKAEVQTSSGSNSGTVQVQIQSKSQKGEGSGSNTTKEKKENDKRCSCKPVLLKVLYLNTRSINPSNKNITFKSKIQRIKRLIELHRPNIVAFVESWLRDTHDNFDIAASLGLEDYNIFRQDREDGNTNNAYGNFDNGEVSRRGGGILVAFHCNNVSVTMERNTAEDYRDGVMNFDIHFRYNCEKCNIEGLPAGFSNSKLYGITVVYRRPTRFRNEASNDFKVYQQEIIDRLTHIGCYYNDYVFGYDGFAMVGDFNLSSTNGLFNYILGENPPASPTHNATHAAGGDLDHVIGNPTGFIVNNSISITELITDHSALIFQLDLGKDYATGNKCQKC